MICPYCGKDAEWVENKEIYGKNYGQSYMVWLCRSCDARVGCHNNTEKPLGTMADKETREWRMRAHSAFDPLWKTGGMRRGEAYKLLSDLMGEETHVGESDIEQCKEIIKVLKKHPWSLRTSGTIRIGNAG